MAGYDSATAAIGAEAAMSTSEEEARLRPGAPLDPSAALAGAVAHDLGNMLTVVLGNAELLVEGLADRPELAELAGLILGAAQRGTELTSRLDRFARPVRLAEEPTDLGGVLDDFVRRLAPTLPPGIRLATTIAGDLHPVRQAPVAIIAALDGLVANALAAMGGKGVLRIEAANHRDAAGRAWVRLSVGDDGSGMQPETLRRVREVRFTAGVAGHKTSLGVALALRVALVGGGGLLVDSAPGAGSLVTLELAPWL